MRELTFPGFLKRYVSSLSESGTGSLAKLAVEAAGDNPRLREPLLLYALFTDRSDALLRGTKDATLHSSYTELLRRFNKGEMETALADGSNELPEEYRKVWRSYLAEKNRHRSDNETKQLMRNRVLALQEKTGVSNYRLYTDLHMNPGNMNAWLKHGDGRKLGLSAARATLAYLKTQPSRESGPDSNAGHLVK